MNKNNIIRRIVLSLVGLISIVSTQAQQNIQFTQYIFNSLSVNPAYAGYKEEWFAQVGLRSQWTGWKGAPKTGSISIDGVLDPVSRRHGVGLQITADGLGAQTATSIYANYALRLRVDAEDTKRLSLGVAAGVTQYGLDGGKLEAVTPGDQVLPVGKISTWVPDVRLGVYYATPKIYAGAAVHDLFSSAVENEDFQFNENSLESLYKNVSLYVIAGGLITLDEGMHIRPSLLVKDDFKGPTSLDVNAMAIFNHKFWIGGGYRTRSRIFKREYYDNSAMKLSSLNSLQAIVQFYVTPRFRIGYSYDVMLNKMQGLQSGTHEVTLGVTFDRALKQVISPRFF